MDPSAAGAVVLVPFPFSDLSATKLRPAIAIAPVGRDDWILCQVTSKPYGDPLAIPLGEADFKAGSLRIESFARPGKLFTAHVTLMKQEVGCLTDARLERIVAAITAILVNKPSG